MEAFNQVRPFLPTYAHLLFAALLPIYTGAHASLRRPLNTLSPSQLKALKPSGESDTDDDDTEERDDEDAADSANPVEKLTATDAMMFPVTAGVVLGGLYMIIKYLDDPTLLSRILTWYFCFMGVFAVGKAYSDTMNVAVSYIFPARFRDSTGRLFAAGFDAWAPVDPAGPKSGTSSPLLFFTPPAALNKSLWAIRRELRARWVLHLQTADSKKPYLKPFWLGDLTGPIVGAIIVGVYALGGKHWIMTNIMGLSFTYGAMQLISPTTFPIATLMLGLLFVYDIVMVFYTPLMVTVATNLDVPIKLLFPRPGTTALGAPALAMLGLGDLVIPGLVIAMALRWDLWRHYELQRRALLKAAASESGEPLDAKTRKALKPRYLKATSQWGERYWSGCDMPVFKKTYFTAAMVGYVVAMVTTLGVMHVFKHAQPALLYLVPGVLSAVWGTAAVKGEIKVLWNYSEEEEEDKKKDEDEDDEKTKDEKEKKQKEVVEVERTMLDLKIIRKPALGAAKAPAKPTTTTPKDSTPATPATPAAAAEDSDTDLELDPEADADAELELEDDTPSELSSDVVEVDRDAAAEGAAKMWSTTIIGSDG
ncbi:signal peptide peptidase-domain-containing protein [Geopyxis carbonaria]|nr:signal peptide peptidase-domain-containing protein [Geopyxis carbonaria]